MSSMVIGSKEEVLAMEITNFTERYCDMLEIILDFEVMVLAQFSRPSRKLKKIFSDIRALRNLTRSFKIKCELDYDDPSSIKSHYIEIVWQGKEYSTKNKQSNLSKRALVTYITEFANAIIKQIDEIKSEDVFVMARIAKMGKDIDCIVEGYLS